MAFLDRETFTTVIDSTPLVSIDLVVENEQGEFLLGQRKNRPAQGYWFVPGGRILKGEPMVEAFKRLTHQELGTAVPIEMATLLGPYEHFYDDFVFGSGVSTHYVVLGYKVRVQTGELALPLEQHNDYQWFSKASLLASQSVHKHSKWYFDKSAV